MNIIYRLLISNMFDFNEFIGCSYPSVHENEESTNDDLFMISCITFHKGLKVVSQFFSFYSKWTEGWEGGVK